MRLLIDTHVFVWMTAEPERIGKAVQAALDDEANTVFVSAVSAWEIAIKRAVRQIDFPIETLDAIMDRAGFEPLPVTARHGIEAGGLPPHHRDPFDRMLIAQARIEDLVLVSDDRAFAPYEVRLLGRDRPG